MQKISDNQKNFINSLISEAGEGAPTFEQISEAFINTPEDARKEVLDTYIQTLRSMKRSRNETLPVTDSTYDSVRECDAIKGSTTEREGLTEAKALAYIKKTKIDAGTSVPTPGMKQLLFKLLFQSDTKMTKDEINSQIASFKTSGTISAEIDRLIEIQKNDPKAKATPKQKRNLEWLLKKDGMGSEDIKKLVSSITKSDASTKLSELFAKYPKKAEIAPEVVMAPESQEYDDDDMPF